MQTTLSKLMSSVRLFTAGTCAVLFAALTLCLCAVPALGGSPSPPIVVTGPTVLIGNLALNGAGGGWFSGQAPLGGTFVVGANGDVIVGDGYGGNATSGVFQITPAGVQTILANFTNSNAAGMDQYGNVYVGRDYGSSIIKIPFDAATGQYVGFPPTASSKADDNVPTTNCTGGTQDTAPCVFVSGSQSLFSGENAGFAALFFDAQGNFFFATDSNPKNNPNTIYECVASSLPACNSPKTIYTDPNAVMGSVAVDPWGNLFFSDGQGNASGKATYVEELTLSGGNYATTATTLTTYTSSAGYNAIAGVAVNGSGTVFFSIPNDGVYAMPNTSSGAVPAGIYKVSNEGGKGLALDAAGNLYVVNYSGTNSADSVFVTPMGSISFAASAVGTASSTAPTVTVIDSAGNCTSPPTLTYTDWENGKATTEFATTASGLTCGTAVNTSQGAFTPALASNGADYSPSLSFTPAAVGNRMATLVITDSANNASGSAALSGIGQGALGNVDPGVSVTFTKSLSTPTFAVADAAGDVFVADLGAAKVFEYPSGSTTSTTPGAVGSGFTSPVALAIDASGDLFVADNGGPDVVEIPNTSTTGGFTAGTQQTIIGSSTTFAGAALKGVNGMAVGPRGRLYISDAHNQRVVFYDPVTGQSGVTLGQATIQGLTTPAGLSNPQGLAVDGSSNLYIADLTNNLVFEVSSTGMVTTMATPSGISAVAGIAVDASGSLVVDDNGSGNIALIPSSTSTSNPVTIENMSTFATPTLQANSLWMDWQGDLYVASASSKTVNVILRNQTSGAAINLGSVANGASQTGTVILESAGNATVTLANPDVTEPATYNWITLQPAATKSCTAGTSGPAGAWCEFTATFAPPPGTTAGPYSDTADIVASAPSVSIPVVISGTATASAALTNTITWSPPTTGFVGQTITLLATSTSTEPVSFASTTSSICTVSGTSSFTATYIAAGTCKIQAAVPACSPNGCSVSGSLYAAAAPVTASITITTVTPASVPSLLTTVATSFPSLTGGGVLAGPIAAGTSIGVGNNGFVGVSTTYGGAVDIYNLAKGTVASGSFSNPGGIAADSKGNLYIAGQYNNYVAMIPYANGAYAAISSPSGSTPTCTSSSTTECVLGPITKVSAIAGIGAITFDSNGDLFLAPDPQGTSQFSIWECTAACLSTGTPAPLMIFQEPAGTGNNQLYIGALAVDPWGNLFFTDSYLVNQANTSNNEAEYSDLYELPTSTGAGFGGVTTGFAATPTLLQTYCDGTSPSCGSGAGNYDDNLDALTVAPNGTVYYATLYDGVFAIPNTQSGGPVVANQYPVFGTGAKVLGVDANGNLYEASGNLTEIAINNVTVPTAQYLGTATQGSATVVINGSGYCPTNPAPSLSFTFTGAAAADFAASAGSTCAGLAIGNGFTNKAYASSLPATITFTPNLPGSQTVTMNMSDTSNGGIGTSTVSALAQTTPETISFTGPTTTTYTYSAPPSPQVITLTVQNGPSNFPATFSVDASSTGAGTLSTTTVSGSSPSSSTATLTVTQAGTIVIDAYEPGGLASNHIYYSQSPQVQLTLTINPASQTINFTTISPLTYTYLASPQVTISLSATGGASGNPVTFSVDASSTGAGTVSATTTVGNASLATLTITQAGSIVIDANQAKTVNYAAATQAQQTITVNQAAQTITFVPPTAPIHFIAASTGITGGITIPVSAIGGLSDNAIVFSVDKSSTMTGTFGTSTVSGATSTATLTIPVQGSLTSGSIVIDATQPQSTNYAAVTVAPLGTITILPPLPLQLITFNNPGTQVVGTALTLAATASSTLPVSYVSTTTSVCTVAGSAVSFASTVTSASSCTIVASQPGDNINWAAAPSVTQSFTVNPKGQNPTFNLTLSLSSLTIQPGTSGLTLLTLTSQNNFTGTLSLACSGLPSGYTCTFNPSTLTISAGGTASTTLTVTPPATATLIRQNTRPLLPITALAVAFCFLGFRKRTRLQSLLLLVLGMAVLGLFAACGGSASTTTTPPTTSTATVTISASGMAGASGSVQQTATLSVTVE